MRLTYIEIGMSALLLVLELVNGKVMATHIHDLVLFFGFCMLLCFFILLSLVRGLEMKFRLDFYEIKRKREEEEVKNLRAREKELQEASNRREHAQTKIRTCIRSK